MNNFDKHILVIDDEQKWADRFKNILVEQGYRIVDVQYGVKKFSDILQGYDLTIIDIKMPRYDGFQIKDYLKTKSPKTKILLTSQYEDFGLGLLHKAKGADGWIEKKELDENEVAFILLVEELLGRGTEEASLQCKENVLDKIVLNEINKLEICTTDQIELKKELIKLKEKIGKSEILNKDDVSLNVDQLSSELSKRKKDKNYIEKTLEEIREAAGHIDEIDAAVGKITEIIINKVSNNNLFKAVDIEFEGIKKAVEAAGKCVSEDKKIHPKVGAVIIKDDQVICEAYRGELEPGDHAEYTALIKKCRDKDLERATLITTLEPCTTRKHDKKPCALHIVEKGIKKVIVGMIDPNPEIRGKGVLFLQRKKIEVEIFPIEYQKELRELNKEFWDTEWEKYKIDLMKDLGSEMERYEKEIKEDFYCSEIQRIKIFQILKNRLKEEDVKTLCEIYLGIDYDDIEGNTKAGKLRELIRRFERGEKISKLLDAIKNFMPEVWEEVVHD